MAIIILVAAAARLGGLTRFPPGLHQDEAANAWNAYCLLKTGRDQAGAPWPIFYYRALGENRSALFLYVLLPFQAAWGLNVWTTRLPAAVGGVLTVLLMYWVGRRLFGDPAGVLAAGLLAINPTHIQMSRWGHEASLTPLLVLAPLAAWLWAGFPPAARSGPPSTVRAALAGLLAGVCCYGYPAARLYLPVFLAASVLVSGSAWAALLRSGRGARAVLAALLMGGLTFGPLAYQHLAAPQEIGRRGEMTRIWKPDDPWHTRAATVLDRYRQHFGPRFLFIAGDADGIAWTAGLGFLPWYLLPLMATGLGMALWRCRDSQAARVLLVGAVAYPVGDALHWHISLHGLRSSAGLPALVLLAAVGAAGVLRYLHGREGRAALVAATVGLGGLIVPEAARFAHLYVTRGRQLAVYNGNHVDLLEACDWLRPRLAAVDHVIATVYNLNQPYLITLVYLGHDPARWFAEPHVIHRTASWDYHERYGKFWFLHRRERETLLDELARDGRRERVVLLLRPTETPPAPAAPDHTVTGPDGKPSLLVFDLWL